VRELSRFIHRAFRNVVHASDRERRSGLRSCSQRGVVLMAPKLLIGAVAAGGLTAGFLFAVSGASAPTGAHASVALAEERRLYGDEVALNGQEQHLQALLHFSEAVLARPAAPAAPQPATTAAPAAASVVSPAAAHLAPPAPAVVASTPPPSLPETTTTVPVPVATSTTTTTTVPPLTTTTTTTTWPGGGGDDGGGGGFDD
jgi:hypothetical protein